VEYWRDRLQRLAGLGLNAVQLYMPWNWHEQVPGQYDFAGGAMCSTRLPALCCRG
jgi:beta-galactosidase GanA